MNLWQVALNALGVDAVTGTASPHADSTHLESLNNAAAFATPPMPVIDRRAAMSIPVVRRARNLIASTIGRLPLVETVAPNAEPTKLLTQPEPGRTRANSITWLVDQLIFYPHAHWHVIDRNGRGYPTAVELLPYDAVSYDATTGAPTLPPGMSAANLIRFDSPDEGLLAAGADVLRRSLSITAAASRAESNPVPALDLHNNGEELTAAEIEQLLSSWERARARRGVAYSSRSLEVRPLGSSTENLLIEGRRQIDLELVRAIGLPAWAADVVISGSSLNYTNRESRNAELIDFTLAPYMTAITERLSLGDVTPSGRNVTFDTDALVKPSRENRWKTLEIGINAGIITAEEARKEEGLDR
ncbi:phage portal protein [Gulosibacter bifidus]|uniref:Phage portal protein n=1 Tax=Gulosibacter bifidus TaxID=272239 RepID=A0ABW5RKD9_9MICO|nr:phage portal protein [Gulosibacter bifidus]